MYVCTHLHSILHRLAVLIHALLEGIDAALHPDDDRCTNTKISANVTKTALAITRYCSYQREVLKEVDSKMCIRMCNPTNSHPSIRDTPLLWTHATGNQQNVHLQPLKQGHLNNQDSPLW
jgi:hypothetical protein